MTKRIYYRTVELIYADKNGTEFSVEVRHAFTYPEDGDKWVEKIIRSNGQSLLEENLGMLLCKEDRFIEFSNIQDIMVELD